MRQFSYSRPATLDIACHNPDDARYLAGGTNLIDLMKSDVGHPENVLDFKALPMS